MAEWANGFLKELQLRCPSSEEDTASSVGLLELVLTLKPRNGLNDSWRVGDCGRLNPRPTAPQALLLLATFCLGIPLSCFSILRQGCRSPFSDIPCSLSSATAAELCQYPLKASAKTENRGTRDTDDILLNHVVAVSDPTSLDLILTIPNHVAVSSCKTTLITSVHVTPALTDLIVLYNV